MNPPEIKGQAGEGKLVQRFRAFLVIPQSAAMSSSRLSGRPLASVALKWVQTNNDLCEKMLAKTMTYSCGYFRGIGPSDAAQEAKLDVA
jgi:cyclopropane fatty-acyl-phospholipid synthase-like methyltransferase